MESREVKVSKKAVILSAGQLAQLALGAATKREMEVVLLADKDGSPAGKLINPITGVPFVLPENNIIVPKLPDGTLGWSDPKTLDKLAEIAGDTDVPVTTEWENIPAETAEYLEKLGFTVYPNSQILKTIQDRYTEKQSIESKGLLTVPFAKVKNIFDIKRFIVEHGGYEVGYILKTRKGGYDGSGQVRILKEGDVDIAFGKLKTRKGGLIIEKMVDLESEFSVIVARDRHGNIGNLEPILNHHEGGILRRSITTSHISQELKDRLIISARSLISNWEDYVGILTVEFFLDKEGNIYVNEIAPRTHNSGHATLDNGGTSQNDLWMDAISGRVIDVVKGTREVAMLNLLTPGALAHYRVLSQTNPHLSFYDYLKLDPDDDGLGTNIRKVGHVNLISEQNNRLLY